MSDRFDQGAALFDHLEGEKERDLGERAAAWAEKALADDGPVATPFFEPSDQQVVQSVISRMPAVACRWVGGYQKARRQRALIFPHYYLLELLPETVAAVSIHNKEKLSPGDVITSFSELGISPDQLGDVIMTDSEAQVIIAQEMATDRMQEKARDHAVLATMVFIDLEQIEGAYSRVKEIRTTVASLRLDAVAGAGFGTSRTRIARDIQAERIKLNWSLTKDRAKEVKPGDVISMRGRGRVEIVEITGTSRKGRVGVLLKRFL